MNGLEGLDRDSIFEFFKQHPERPWHVQDIQKRLQIDDRSGLRKLLAELTDEGKLIRTRRRAYGLPQEMNLFLGKLQVTSGGYGFVIPESGNAKDLFIPVDRLAGAWDGDKVVARPNPMKSDNGRTSGEVVRILERKHQRVVGTLEYSRGYAILRPDSPKLRERILLTPDSVGKLDAGSRIVARMAWPEESGDNDPFAEVEEYLGDGDTPEIETRAVIVKYDLKDDFDPDTMAEASAVPSGVTGDLMAGRTDYRSTNTFTIDGADAKDFDDAISLERLEGSGKSGLLRVGVHIADVSYYVAEGTSLDKEALERATSVYLPGKVLPMLPEQLSNGICSLVEGEPRLALSAFIDITRDGEVKGVLFKETVIKSDARLTYEEVQEFTDGGRLPQGKRKLERDIKLLAGLTQKFREQRIGAGALDFEFTEAKVDVDEEGALHLTPIRSNQARQLIEELMLLSNRLVAKELHDKDIPALYRVHEDPSEEKIQALQKALAKLGYILDLESAKPQDLQNILREAAGKPEAQLVSTLLLRSLKQARYSSENLGHFGLAFENYLHFTSPIRRYPDLVVHRVLRALLQHRLSPTLKERMKSDFPKLAQHASDRERLAEEAERDLTRYFHAKWAKERIGETFNGVISGVTNFGIFVALPNGIEGLIHVSQLDDDYYMFLEDSLMLMGKHSRKKFRMGDRLEVKIFQSNPTIRQIDLIPGWMELPEVEPEEKPQRGKAPKNLKSPGSHDREEDTGKTPEPRPIQAGSDTNKGSVKRGSKVEVEDEAPAKAKRGRSKSKRPADAPVETAQADAAPGKTGSKAKPKSAAAVAVNAMASERPSRRARGRKDGERPNEARSEPGGTRGAQAKPHTGREAAQETRESIGKSAERPSGRRRRRRLVFGDPGPSR
ncbi:MAG: ribonuclease R [Trueperaceae bacterium]